jgi:hypothetical protein
MSVEWLMEPVTLPRWVVWGALLTSPALWSSRVKEILRKRFWKSGQSNVDEHARG